MDSVRACDLSYFLLHHNCNSYFRHILGACALYSDLNCSGFSWVPDYVVLEWEDGLYLVIDDDHTIATNRLSRLELNQLIHDTVTHDLSVASRAAKAITLIHGMI